MNHHEFRKDLSKKMREEFEKKNEELERVEKSPYYSKDLKQKMILEINEVFERQMDEFRQTPGFKEAMEAHNKIIESKIKLLKTLKEKEDIQKKYEDLFKESEKNIVEKKKNYQESKNSYLGDYEETGAYNRGDYHDIQEYSGESRRHLYDKSVGDENKEEKKIKFLDNEDLNTTDSDNLDIKQPIKQDKNIQPEKRKPCNIITKTKSLRHGGCIVEKGGKYGLLNSVKKVTIPLEYDSIEPISEVDNYYIIGKGGKYGLVNRSGKEILPLKYDDIEFDWEIRKAYYYIIKQGDKYGIFKYGHSTRKLSDIIYDEIITFEEVDQDSYLSDTGYPIYKVRIGDKYGLVNRELNSVLPIEYDDIEQTDRCYYIVKKGDKYGAVDNKRHELIDVNYSEKQILKMSKYDQIEKIGNVGFCMGNRDGFGIMNSKGKVLLPTEYSVFREIIEGGCFIWTKKNGKKEYWFIDDKGKAITQMDEIPKYDYIKKINGGFLASISGSYLKIYNEKGKFIVKSHYRKGDEVDKNFIESVMKYDVVEEYNGYYMFEKDGKWGAMDKKGKERINPEYLKVQVMQWLKPSKK